MMLVAGGGSSLSGGPGSMTRMFWPDIRDLLPGDELGLSKVQAVE
jgi:hypothetical protein